MSVVAQLKRVQRDERGQALVEFALIMPFLLLFIIGIVEFGRGWNRHQVITDAAREGARSAVLFDNAITSDSVRTIVKTALARGGINPNNPDLVITITDEGAGGSSVVAITLPYQFAFFGALKQWTTGESTVLLRTSFTMRNE